MRETATILTIMALMFSFAGCAKTSNNTLKTFDINSIRSYRDIPGVTAEEIAAMEALKNSRERFAYGSIEGMEIFTLPDGKHAGFTTRFCDLLTNLFGIEFSIELHDWDALKSGIDNNLIDFTGELTATPDRMKQYFMTYPIAERSMRIFQLAGSAELLAEKDLNGLRVGFLVDTINTQNIMMHYPDLTFSAVTVENLNTAVKMLESGTIDVFISDGIDHPLFNEYDFIKSKEFFPLIYTRVSMSTANPDLKPVIDIVNKYISAGGTDTLFDYYMMSNKEYARYELSKLFTDEEKAYLDNLAGRNVPVKAALESDNYPISFYNKTDREFQGISVDVLSEISELTGIVFEPVNDENAQWTELFEMLKTGDASIVSQLLYSEERKGGFLWSNNPYASAHYALLSKLDYPNLASYQVARTKVGAIKGTAYNDKYQEWFPDNNNVVLFNSYNAALDALENGEIDLLIGSNYMLLMQQNYREKSGYKMNIRFSAPMESFYGFNKNETVLCSIINKAQFYVNTNTISADWTSRGYDYSQKMAQQKSQFFLGTMVVLIVVLILSLIFLARIRKSNAKLDKTVNEMTQDLRATVAKLHAVIANYSGVIWSVNRDNIITLFNGLYLNEIGITPAFLEGKKLDVARQKNRHLDVIEAVSETFTGGGFRDWVSDVDGRMFRFRTIPIYDENGNVSDVVGNTDDITETIKLQKELEVAVEKAQSAVLALKSAQITVSAMFESNPQMNILFDANFRMLDCNPAAYAFMGFKTKEDMQSGFVERMTQCIPELQSNGRQSISMAERLITATKEGHVKFETELTMDGATRILNVELKKIPYEESFAVVAYVFDVTEIHKREMELIRRDQQLLEAVEEARAANHAKSAFLSNMSHEIRTPMNAILGIAEIQLQNKSMESDLREALGKIYNSGALLLAIINDILDMSKIEAGRLELIITDYSIASLINDTAQINMMRIGSKLINFELFIDENIPSVLVGDELRIRQILNNLLSNAFKYTEKGQVALLVSAETCKDREDKVIIVFGVKDTGQGMTSEQVSRLFDEYSRFNLEANRTTEGTGLGMSITRNLVRMMNGEILVESEPDKGSLFTVRIPQGDTGAGPLGKELAENLQQFQAAAEDYTKRASVSREPMPYGRVLIVDDVETNIYVARGLLSPYSLGIDSAESGPSAIEKIKKGNVYDIVFMDHMMPKMDGIEATKIIRSMGYKGAIVALTANAVVGQSDIFLGSGFDEFISKPIDIRQLNAALNKFIRDRQPQEVINAARRQAYCDKENDAGKKQPALDPGLAKIFVRDASKAMAALQEIQAKQGELSKEDIRTYTVSIHGMKSALANIGQTELSAVARELEHAGRDNNFGVMSTGTQSFLDSLQALIKELTTEAEETVGETAEAEDDRPFLLEKLHALKEACDAYDKKTAKGVIAEIMEKSWSQPTMKLLDVLAEHLLHSDFDEIATAVDKFIAT